MLQPEGSHHHPQVPVMRTPPPPHGGTAYPYMMPVPNPAAHPMYFYPGQNMSPVPPQMGHIGDKNASPSMPTGVQHTPNVKTCAARSLGGEFNVVESDRNERESSPSRSGQINLQKLKSAFKGAGIEYIESKVNENDKAVSNNNEVTELISRVCEAGGKVVENADKTLTIHVPESKAKCGGGKQKANEANSIDATTGKGALTPSRYSHKRDGRQTQRLGFRVSCLPPLQKFLVPLLYIEHVQNMHINALLLSVSLGCLGALG